MTIHSQLEIYLLLLLCGKKGKLHSYYSRNISHLLTDLFYQSMMKLPNVLLVLNYMSSEFVIKFRKCVMKL